MSTAIQEKASVVAVHPQASSLLEAISRAASDTAMDIDKVERLFKMHESMQKQQAEVAFNTALASAQAEMTTVVKNKQNDFTRTRYADLDTIINCISPIYTSHGFSVSFNTEDCEDKSVLRVAATLSHSGGHSRQYRLDAPLDDTGSGGKTTKTKIQATGSTNSYARRYLICMIFNVTTADDNDGNGKKSMLAENVEPGRRPFIQKLASEMLSRLRNDLVADAVDIGESADLGIEERAFLWSFFNASQRGVMNKVGAAKRQSSKITDAQKKRLEARIGEYSLYRDAVKKYCEEQYGVEHFADLTNADYEDLDATLESMDRPPASTAATLPEPSQEDLGQGSGPDDPPNADLISPDEALAIEARCTENGIMMASVKKYFKVERFSQMTKAQLVEANERIDETLALRKAKLEAQEAALTNGHAAT